MKNFDDKQTERMLKEKAAEAEAVIRGFLPAEEGFARSMAAAMNYSMLAGGKRIRPVLLLEVNRLFGGDPKAAFPFAAGMEMIHTHSLVHDDLPAIDNDDYRRGRLTTHKVYGEAMGVLAGDALLNYAYETMLKAFGTGADPDRVVKALQVMSRKAGLYGMLGGQSVDVENDGKELSEETLSFIYLNKTSALIEAPMMTGAILAGASEEAVSDMEKAGRAIGLAFQLRDDILDIISTQEELGKPIGSDEKNHKVTGATLLGLEGAMKKVEEYSEEAEEILSRYAGTGDFLMALVQYLTDRRY